MVMGVLAMVLGRSGSGKSASLRGFAPGEVGVFNVASKPLPFRARLPTADGAGYAAIEASLARNALRAYVVDDAGYLMQFENFARAKEQGYGKFTDMAKGFYDLLAAARGCDRDTVTYFLMHPDSDDLGRERPKTIGRMLDEKLCIEGLFSVVLDCEVRDGEHVFAHEPGPGSIAKAPEGMFPPGAMPNDLKAVDAAIRGYWGLAPLAKAAKEEGKTDEGV